MTLSFPQADAIIEQLTTRIHDLIGTEYRDAAVAAANRARNLVETAASIVALETPPGSGLYRLGGQDLALNETAPDSGLYQIGALQ